MSKELSIRRYILKFGMVYTIGIFILSTGFIIFNLSHSAPASIIVLMGAAFFTVSEFIQDHERVPGKKEKSMLIWLSFLMAWLALLILAFAVVVFLGGQQAMTEFGNMIKQINGFKLIGVIALISLVYLAILFLSYGKLAKIQYNAMRKKGIL